MSLILKYANISILDCTGDAELESRRLITIRALRKKVKLLRLPVLRGHPQTFPETILFDPLKLICIQIKTGCHSYLGFILLYIFFFIYVFPLCLCTIHCRLCRFYNSSPLLDVFNFKIFLYTSFSNERDLMNIFI